MLEIFNEIKSETDTLTLTSIFGKTQRKEEEKIKVFEYNELLKTINYVTIQNHRKNKTNVLKRYRANELCMTALKETANYSFKSTGNKIDLKK